MTFKPLTTAALLAAMALPALAEDAPAPATVDVDHDVVVVQNNGGDADRARRVVVVEADRTAQLPAEAVTLTIEAVEAGGVDGAEGGDVTARVIMMDAEGNIIHLEGDPMIEWVPAENLHVEMVEMGVPGVELIEGEDGDVRVFLRQIGQPDVVGQAPVNPPMVEATYLGLNCEPLDFDTAALLLIDEGTGLDVTFVAPDSPASAAGLRVGDTLLKMDDQILVNPEQLAVLIRRHDAGDAVTLRVLRENEEFDLTAELGTNTVPQLGPGGRNLNQFWNVERQGNAGQGVQWQVFPEGLHGRLAQIHPGGEDVDAQIEMIQRLIAEHMQAMPDIGALQDQAEQMRERMRLHEIELQRMFEELDIQPGEFDQQRNRQFRFDGNADAAMQIAWSDGEHNIRITGDGQGNQTLNIKDADGNELYDGPMPEGDALDELPGGVGDKVREMTLMQRIEAPAPPAPPAPAAPVAPAQPDAPADF